MEPTLSEIRIFAGNYAPRSWMFCDGRLLQISQYTALFALVGTIYGGNGTTTFALPDLRGRIPVGTGQSPGSSDVNLGEVGGSETVTLNVMEIPSHIHTGHGNASPNAGSLGDPNGALLATAPENIYTSGPASVPMAMNTVQVGLNNGNQPHNNIMPILAMNYIIAVEGIFPSRN